MSRQKRAALSRKQMRFVEEYDRVNGNATEAARRAGYSQSSETVIGTIAWENMQKPAIRAALAKAEADIAGQITPGRVKRRLHEISHASQDAGQFGPAVRAEELLGKSVGMWIDQTLQLTGVMSDSHISALLEIARQRQAQPIDLSDDDDAPV
jgi:hypothetical protein